MRKFVPLLIIFVVFLGSFFYLHQKVQAYIQAYKLSQNYRLYTELIDKRDCYAYYLKKKLTFAKVDKWAQENNFSPVDKQRLVVLNVGQSAPLQKPQFSFALAMRRILNNTTTPASVFAKDRID